MDIATDDAEISHRKKNLVVLRRLPNSAIRDDYFPDQRLLAGSKQYLCDLRTATVDTFYVKVSRSEKKENIVRM